MSEWLRVLIIEDSEDFALRVAHLLQLNGYQPSFERIETGAAMQAALDRQTWDLVLSEPVLPAFSAIEALNLIQQRQLDPPFIVVSDHIDEEAAMTAMRAGAHDYLVKDNLARLAPAIERELRAARQRKVYREAERKLRQRAEVLQAANLALTQTLDLDSVLHVLLSYLKSLVPYDSANVMLLNSGVLSVCSVRGYRNPEEIRRITFALEQYPYLDQIVTQRQGLLVQDTRRAAAWLPHPASRHVRCWLGVPLIARGEVIGLCSLDKTVPGFFTTEHLRLAETLAAQAAIAIQNAQLHEQTELWVRELTAIHQAGQRLRRLYSPDMLAQEIIGVLEDLLDYKFGAVLLIDEHSGELVPFALSDRGQSPDFASADTAGATARGIRLGKGLIGWVAQTGESVRLGDVHRDPRYLAIRPDIRSELCVPLRLGDQVVGVVNIETTRPEAYTAADQRVLETVAAQIAVAIQNHRLFEQVNVGRDRLQAMSYRLLEVQESERRLIARELHDEVGQILTGLSLTLGMALQLPADRIRTNLEEAHALVNDLLARVRNLSLDLRPAMLDDLGLLPALLWHIDRYIAQTQVEVRFGHAGLERRFNPEVETAAYRIVQEALTNVARYARVDQVTVRIWANHDCLTVLIEDHGDGFDPAVALSRGASSGLSGMRDRAELLGGTLSIESAVGGGTRLMASLPLLVSPNGEGETAS